MYGHYIVRKAQKWICMTRTDNKIKVVNPLLPVKQAHSKGQFLCLPLMSIIATERRRISMFCLKKFFLHNLPGFWLSIQFYFRNYLCSIKQSTTIPRYKSGSRSVDYKTDNSQMYTTV